MSWQYRKCCMNGKANGVCGLRGPFAPFTFSVLNGEEIGYFIVLGIGEGMAYAERYLLSRLLPRWLHSYARS